MKHTEIAGVLGAALLVATCSAHMSAKTLIPSIDLSPADALIEMRGPTASTGPLDARFPDLQAAIRRNACAVARACTVPEIVPQTIAQRAF